MTIEIVMIKEAQEADRRRPVRVSRRQRSFRIKGRGGDTLIHTGGPRRRVIELIRSRAQAGIEGIFFKKKAQRLGLIFFS